MKLMKRLAAVLLAGVLTASVLTGCGADKNAVSTAKIADAMNQYVAAAGLERTYSADSKLDTKAAKIASAIEESANGKDFKGMDEDEVYDEVMKIAQPKIADVVSDMPTAIYDDESKPVVMLALAKVPASVKDEETLSAFYAAMLSSAAPTMLNAPKGVNPKTDLSSKWAMGSSTCTVNGQKILVVFYTATLQSKG